MSHFIDRTLIDIGRREPNIREYVVEDALSQHIVETYPKFVSFLKEYFRFEESDDSPSHLIQELFYTRDVSQMDLELLSYVENELLLGESYFEGFTDKRELSASIRILCIEARVLNIQYNSFLERSLTLTLILYTQKLRSSM